MDRRSSLQQGIEPGDIPRFGANTPRWAARPVGSDFSEPLPWSTNNIPNSHQASYVRPVEDVVPPTIPSLAQAPAAAPIHNPVLQQKQFIQPNKLTWNTQSQPKQQDGDGGDGPDIPWKQLGRAASAGFGAMGSAMGVSSTAAAGITAGAVANVGAGAALGSWVESKTQNKSKSENSFENIFRADAVARSMPGPLGMIGSGLQSVARRVF